MARATKPYHDCPRCPRCGRDDGVTYSLADGPLPAPQLQCAACGERWDGTPEARAMAERADAAWAVEVEKRVREVA